MVHALGRSGWRRHHPDKAQHIGLLYYTARYYNPRLGRFISADSIVPGAGSLTLAPHDSVASAAWGKPSGGPANPQDLNRYSYALNNPLKNTDPTGHCRNGAGGQGKCGGGRRGGGGGPSSTPLRISGPNVGWMLAAGGQFVRAAAVEVGRAAVETSKAIIGNPEVQRFAKDSLVGAVSNVGATIAVDGIIKGDIRAGRYEELASKVATAAGIGGLGGGTGGLFKDPLTSAVVNSGVTITLGSAIERASGWEIARSTAGEVGSMPIAVGFANARVPTHIRLAVAIIEETTGGVIGGGLSGFGD